MRASIALHVYGGSVLAQSVVGLAFSILQYEGFQESARSLVDLMDSGENVMSLGFLETHPNASGISSDGVLLLPFLSTLPGLHFTPVQSQHP